MKIVYGSECIYVWPVCLNPAFSPAFSDAARENNTQTGVAPSSLYRPPQSGIVSGLREAGRASLPFGQGIVLSVRVYRGSTS